MLQEKCLDNIKNFAKVKSMGFSFNGLECRSSANIALLLGIEIKDLSKGSASLFFSLSVCSEVSAHGIIKIGGFIWIDNASIKLLNFLFKSLN